MTRWDEIRERAARLADEMIGKAAAGSATLPAAEDETPAPADLAAEPKPAPAAEAPTARPAAKPIAEPAARAAGARPTLIPGQMPVLPPLDDDDPDVDTLVMSTMPIRSPDRKPTAGPSPAEASQKEQEADALLDSLLDPRVLPKRGGTPAGGKVATTAAAAAAAILDEEKTKEEAPGKTEEEEDLDIDIEDEDEDEDDEDEDEDEDEDDEDEDDEDEDDDELEGEDWAGWDPNDHEAFWLKVYEIEEEGDRGDSYLKAVLAKHGLRSKAHFDQVRETFERHAPDPDAFMQAGINARIKAINQQTVNRMQGELAGELEPVGGISLEQWAWLMAQIAGGGNLDELLTLAELEKPKWDEISAEWNARMERDTTATIATAYGAAFTASGPGPFAAAGAAVGAALLDPTKAGVDGEEPIPMELWIEVTEAQSAAAAQGIDASTVLASYNMTPAQWGTVGGWWGQHFTANAMRLMPEYNRLQAKYKEKFASGFTADDIEF